ncbi:hypothetical protein L915_02897 [Phytophthora nicotianae]|uniref:Uncharacterized protein n=1 Tax=Phytophthora nicotianae TaxID=4792 RepID=W2JLU3_PHYNI|nr:hypothetical protein L915_02897 [Phytophthora nicotianae]ETL47374.1 hypothetical protein L916_02873 [Phytophthora nicotianae]ETM53672.1 hypothetical protein L914_02871 [Phytophthora nicotianae]
MLVPPQPRVKFYVDQAGADRSLSSIHVIRKEISTMFSQLSALQPALKRWRQIIRYRNQFT